MGEYSALELFVAGLITWGWGLGIPLLLRFVIIRKPFKKWIAVCFSIYWVFQNIILFSVLGATLGEASRSHAVQYIIGFIVFALLTYKPKTEEEKQKEKSEPQFRELENQKRKTENAKNWTDS